MRKLLPIALLTLFSAPLHAQLDQLAWLRQTTNTGVADGSILKLDAAGNLFMAGAYPPAGITIGGITLPGSGSPENAFLAKLAPDGTALWARRMTRVGGMQDNLNSDKIAIDAAGNSYVAGWFLDGATIDGAALTGSGHYVLAKFDADGMLQWTRTIATEDNIQNGSIAVYIDPWQHVQLVGAYATSVTFGAGHTVTNTQPGLVDTFMAWYDAGGEVLDARRLGGSVPTTEPWVPLPAEAYMLDAAGQLFRFVQGANTLFKYAADGTWLMTHHLEVVGGVYMKAMTTGPDGSIWLCGGHSGGGTSLEGVALTPTGSTDFGDALLMKLSAAGELQWIRQYADPLGDFFTRVRVDAIGNATVLGSVASIGLVRVMVVKYAANGDLLSEGNIYPWDGIFGTPVGTILPQNLVLTHVGGNVLLMGSYKYRLYFDEDINFTTTADNYRIFLAQFGTCAVDTPTIVAAAPGFCPGEGVALTAGAADRYRWSTGDTTAGISATAAGAYHVFAIEGGECFARSADVSIDAYEVPEPEVILGEHELSCSVEEVAYQWIDCADNAPIATATARTFAPPADGTYAVRITTAQGCEALSACATYSTVGIGEQERGPAIALWPNPAADRVGVRANGPVRRVDVIDASGACVLTARASSFAVAHLASGTYAVRVTTDAATGVVRLVKE
ncbi:MAG: T9SS type A sorting domain-containing protein [Bacteroidetes bacterium]|nr:T9SS type A sorting domain-containing protein [Bacteroidota bacterium]